MRYFTLAILLVSLSGFSQTISKQVIGPAGATYENGTNQTQLYCRRSAGRAL